MTVELDAATFEALPDRHARDAYVARHSPSGHRAIVARLTALPEAASDSVAPLPRRALLCRALVRAAHPVPAAPAPHRRMTT